MLLHILAIVSAAALPADPPTVSSKALRLEDWAVQPDGERRCSAHVALADGVSLSLWTDLARNGGIEIILPEPADLVTLVLDWEAYPATSSVPIDGGRRRVSFDVRTGLARALRNARFLSVANGPVLAADVQFEDAPALVTALIACLNRFDKLDVGSGKPAVSLAVPVTAAPIITADDYPNAALRNDLGGTVRYRASISAGGFVSDCEVVGSSGTAMLDEAACRLVRERARFTPARDAEGRTTASTSQGNIHWVLPD